MYHRPINSIRSQLTKVKDKTDKLKKCGVVYYMQCEHCREDYVGEIGRSLDIRLKEHVSRSNSAVYEHCQDKGHHCKPENTKVIT